MSARQRRIAVTAGVLLGVVALTVGTGAVGSAAAQDSAVTITNATVTTPSPAADEPFVVRATITNAASADSAFDLKNVYVQGPEGRSDVARDLGSLAPGSSTTVKMQTTVDDPGWHSLSVQVSGTDTTGVVTLQHPVPVQVGDEEASQISMAATAEDLGPSGRSKLHVTVANGFDRAITGVDLQVASDGMTLPEPTRVASRLVPGNQTTFTFPVRDVEPGEHTVSATLQYTANRGDRRTIQRDLSTVISSVDEPGTIKLTGIFVEREEEYLAVQGTASNEGTTDVSGVNISVVDGETAGPADSSSTHFVGTVPASDFNSFDVRAEAKANDTVQIPLRASYVVDGVRTTQTFEVTHELDSDTSPGRNPGGSGGGGGSSLLVIGAVLLVVGAGVFGWRLYRG